MYSLSVVLRDCGQKFQKSDEQTLPCIDVYQVTNLSHFDNDHLSLGLHNVDFALRNVISTQRDVYTHVPYPVIY